MTADGGDLSVIDEFKRVAGSGVLSDADAVVIDNTGTGNKLNIFEDSSELYGIENFGFFFWGETHAFSIAAAFDVENSLLCPDMLVVTDKVTISDSGESSFAGSGQSEEEADVSVLADVAAGVEGEMSLLGHEVVHDGEDSLLHFSCILTAEDEEFAQAEVDADGSIVDHIGDELVGSEFTSVEDVVVSSIGEVFLQLLRGGLDQHVSHKESVVGTGAYHTDLDSLVLVPAGISVHDIDL